MEPLIVTSRFVPRSLSRDPTQPQLNYRVDISLTVTPSLVILRDIDYSMGVGHIPNYQKSYASLHNSHYKKRVLDTICETGFEPLKINYSDPDLPYGNPPRPDHRKTILPDPHNVIACLFLDASVLNYSTFEDWASDYGYDTDSRKALKAYEDCLRIGLALRNNLPTPIFDQLQKEAQEW
jgi:hypothetical protein